MPGASAAAILSSTNFGNAPFTLCVRRNDKLTFDSNKADAFMVGAPVFLGTYLLGANFDYRLTFLLFCIPLLLELKDSAPQPVRRIAWGALGCGVLAMWTFYIDAAFGGAGKGLRIAFFLTQAAKWGLVVLLAYLFAAVAIERFGPLRKWFPTDGGKSV